MPQNIDVGTTDPHQAALQAKFSTVSLKQPQGEIRSIDLNKEVSLDSDNDDAVETSTETQTPTPVKRDEKQTKSPRDEGTTSEESSDKTDLEKEADETADKSNDELKFEEPDVEDKPTEDNKEVEQQVVDETGVPDGPRNYKDFPDQTLVPILKALNNTQFKKNEPVLRALVDKARKSDELAEQLKARPEKPVYQFESPESYRLSNEYNALERDTQIGEFEVAHWEQQLVRIANGQPWQKLDYDAKGNRRFITVPALEDGKLDRESELMIQSHLRELHPTVVQIRQQTEQFKQQYQSAAKQSTEALDQVVKRVFPTLDMEKLSPEENALLKRAKQVIPDVFHDHPIVQKLVTRMAVFTERQKNRILALATENKKLKDQLEDKQVAEPAKIPRGGLGKGNGQSGKSIRTKDGRVISADTIVRLDGDDD